MNRKLSIAAAGAITVSTLFSAPLAGAAETVETTTETTSEFTFYRSYQQEFADVFRCSTSPQRWWCG